MLIAASVTMIGCGIPGTSMTKTWVKRRPIAQARRLVEHRAQQVVGVQMPLHHGRRPALVHQPAGQAALPLRRRRRR